MSNLDVKGLTIGLLIVIGGCMFCGAIQIFLYEPYLDGTFVKANCNNLQNYTFTGSTLADQKETCIGWNSIVDSDKPIFHITGIVLFIIVLPSYLAFLVFYQVKIHVKLDYLIEQQNRKEDSQ